MLLELRVWVHFGSVVAFRQVGLPFFPGQIGRALVSLKFCLSCNCIFAAFRLHLRRV